MKEQPVLFIPIGMPCCGKNYFVTHLKEKLRDKLFISDTGDLFRKAYSKTNNSIEMNNYHINMFQDHQKAGYLQDPLLAGSLVVAHFVKNYEKEPFIILDGSPRTIEEFKMLIPFFIKAYNVRVKYIFISVKKDKIIERMQQRQIEKPREDTDTLEKIINRVNEFALKTLPTIEQIEKECKHPHRFSILRNDGSLEEFDQKIKAI